MFARLMGLSTINPTDLYHLIQDSRVTVVDVNARNSWLKARVPKAIHLDPTTLQERDLPSDKSAPLIFYCSNPLCRKAPLAARQAKKMGYLNVQVMSAGITGWTNIKLPVESGESK